MKYLELSKGAYEYYRSNVKGNENVTFYMARKKLTRNVLLALAVEPEKFENQQLYMYGSLYILVDTIKNKIVWLANNRNIPKGWERDEDIYQLINETYRIKD